MLRPGGYLKRYPVGFYIPVFVLLLAFMTIAGSAQSEGPSEWPLLETFRQTLIQYQPEAEALLKDGTIGYFGLAEVYGGREAALVCMLGEKKQDQRVDMQIAVIGYDKEGTAWRVQERRTDFTDLDRILHADPKPKIIRQAGLSLEAFPAFLGGVMNNERRKFSEARKQGDPKQCAAILMNAMSGYSLVMAEDVFDRLSGSPLSVKAVRLAKQSPEGDRIRAEFEITRDDGSTVSEMLLKKEGKGWVIDRDYTDAPGMTVAQVRTLATTVEAYAIDHEGKYPKVQTIDELVQLLLKERYLTPGVGVTGRDGWDTPMDFSVSDDGKMFRIVSAGSDRQMNPDSWGKPGDFADTGEDLVYENNVFVRTWKVK